MPKTVLITGAHGFLGRHVAAAFARDGYSVVATGHGEWAPGEWKNLGISEWHPGDITVSNLERCAGKPDIIVHCAGSGSVPFSIEEPFSDFQRTVATTAAVLEFIRVHSQGTKLIYPSSASVYGKAATSPITEESAAAPISPYGVHKWMSELLVSSYARQFGVSAIVIRFFSVYGCGLRKQLLWDACHKLDAGDCAFSGTGQEMRDWIHVSDATRLLLLAKEHASESCPIVNGATGRGSTVGDIVTLVASHFSLGAPKPQFVGVQREGDPVSYVGDITKARSWGWDPIEELPVNIKTYVTWWRASR